MEMITMTRRDKRTYEIDKLVKKALKSRHLGAKYLPEYSLSYDEQKKEFQDILVRSAKLDSSSEPEEISKIQVDVNEKFYTNLGSGAEDDASTVKIVKTWETSQGYNYEQQTTKGFEWGAGVNIGAQFGLPQVGIGGNLGGNSSFTKKSEETVTTTTTEKNTVRQEAHHEETVKIPPGHKIRVTMTFYRVRYKLDYTMKYYVPKNTSIFAPYCPCCCCCCYFCFCVCSEVWLKICCGIFAPTCELTAGEIFRPLPDFDDSGEFVTFTQEGTLKWNADRMKVDKQIEKLD